MIFTSNLMRSINENKIIPIIRQNGTTDVPTFLKSKLYVNFSKPEDYEFSCDELVRTIHNSPLFEKPPIGNNPFKPVSKEKLDDDIKLINDVLATIILAQGTNSYIQSSVVMSRLKISPVMLRIAMLKLIKLEYANWHGDTSCVTLTDKGLLYAYENKLVT